MTDRSGTYGRPTPPPKATTVHLPTEVMFAIAEMKNPDNLDTDWMMRKASDGHMWLISRMWEDEGSFRIACSVVRWESDLIDVADILPPFDPFGVRR